ncbi:MAG: hypothetical protein RL037_1453 [Bacteroidota bacterium]
MKTVLLVSKFNWDTPVEIPYIFKKAKFKISIYCPVQSWITYSSFYDTYFLAPDQDEQFVFELQELLNRHKFDWILLTEDPLIDLIKRLILDIPILLEMLPIKNEQALEILSSKIGFSRYFQENNFPTPLFKIYVNGIDQVDSLKGIKYPVLNKYDLSWGGTDISISYTFEELEKKLKTIPSPAKLLIQEYIDGEEIRVDALFFQGTLLNYFCAKVLTNTKDRFSYTTRREYFDYQPLFELLTSLGEKVGAHGFANICFIKEKSTGIHYLVEMDLRPNSWMAYSTYLSDYNFVYCLENLKHTEKNNFTKGQLKRPKPIELALFYKDIRRAIWAKDLKGISRWLFGLNGYWRFLPFYDLRLSNKIFKEMWKEIVVFKLKKVKQKFSS